MRCLSPIFLSYPRGIYLRIPARRYDGFNNPFFFFSKAICGTNPLYRIANLEVFHIIPRDSYARPTVWGMKSPAGGGRGVGCYLFFGRGHPHTGQAANLWLVPHLGHSVGGLPPEVFSPLQAALMRAKFFALRLPVHSGRFGSS